MDSAKILLFVLLTVASCTTPQETIKIGASMPMTGDLAYFGESFSTGAQLAIEEINKEGGVNGKELELILYDNQEKPLIAINDFRKISSSGIKAALIPMTRPALAVQEIADREEIVVMSNTITNVGSKYVFKDFYDVKKLGTAMAEAAIATNAANMCIFTLDTKDGNELLKSFEETFGREKISLTEKFPRTGGRVDFRTPLLKAEKEGCGGLYAFLLPNTLVNLLQQMKETDMTEMKLYTVQMQDPVVMSKEGTKEILENLELVISSWFSVNTHENEEYKEFAQSYEEMFGKPPKGDTAYTYDDVKILAKAMRECDTQGNLTSTCIRESILRVENYNGAAGTLTFNGSTNAKREIYLEKFEKGKWVPLEK